MRRRYKLSYRVTSLGLHVWWDCESRKWINLDREEPGRRGMTDTVWCRKLRKAVHLARQIAAKVDSFETGDIIIVRRFKKKRRRVEQTFYLRARKPVLGEIFVSDDPEVTDLVRNAFVETRDQVERERLGEKLEAGLMEFRCR